MEGGGNTKETRAALRQGMDTFLQPLKQAAREKGWYWNVVCRGPRGEAYRAFCDATRLQIRHASDLLKLINRQTVAARCAHCERLFAVLGDMVAAA